MKRYNETYLYKKMPDYEKELTEMIIKGERVDKSHATFSDIKYEVKRKNIDSTLSKLLDSDRIELILPLKPMPKAFKVVTAKDIRNDHKIKVFIDCTGIIESTDAGYRLFNNNTAVNILISYLVAGRTAFIMEAKPDLITLNSSLTMSGTKTFATLFNYIIDYIGKININPDTRNRSLYLASIYYQVNLLGKDLDSKSVKNTALNIAGISEREANILEVDYEKDSFENIDDFIKLIKEALHIKDLTIDTFIERWMFLYGTGTVFGTELFVPFAQMITDAYIGAYINNQKTIEKIAKQNMIDFSKTLIKIGSDS